jgi:hypothetical protein
MISPIFRYKFQGNIKYKLTLYQDVTNIWHNCRFSIIKKVSTLQEQKNQIDQSTQNTIQDISEQ